MSEASAISRALFAHIVRDTQQLEQLLEHGCRHAHALTIAFDDERAARGCIRSKPLEPCSSRRHLASFPGHGFASQLLDFPSVINHLEAGHEHTIAEQVKAGR